MAQLPSKSANCAEFQTQKPNTTTATHHRQPPRLTIAVASCSDSRRLRTAEINRPRRLQRASRTIHPMIEHTREHQSLTHHCGRLGSLRLMILGTRQMHLCNAMGPWPNCQGSSRCTTRTRNMTHGSQMVRRLWPGLLRGRLIVRDELCSRISALTISNSLTHGIFRRSHEAVCLLAHYPGGHSALNQGLRYPSVSPNRGVSTTRASRSTTERCCMNFFE